jgi:superoxide dismutase, Cu-Zn family
MIRVLSVVGGVALTLGAAAAQESLTATATLKDRAGKTVGTATLRDTPNGVLIRLKVAGLEPGERAFHIHAVGRCDPPSFQSAGPHFAPRGDQHGLLARDGYHEGDLPNLHVPADGRLSIEVFNNEVRLRPGDESLFDHDGSALVIHAAADDYTSDPAGNAGDRIACGVVTK